MKPLGEKGGARAVRLRVYHELFTAILEEMGELLRSTAPSVNIRERLDYSCALFDAGGELVAQAAHIPVHLGSAALSVQEVRVRFPDLVPGDAVLLNDPYAGGTHLPDLTLVTPVHAPSGDPWFLVNRAHHSDIGGAAPGSMAPASDLLGEGLRIPPIRIVRASVWQEDLLHFIASNTREPAQRRGDLRAQYEANRFGVDRVTRLFAERGRANCEEASVALRAYSARLLAHTLRTLSPGSYRVHESLEGDGRTDDELELVLELSCDSEGALDFDFRDSCDQGPGSLNANPAIVWAAVLYCLNALVPDSVPSNGGLLQAVKLRTRKGSILDPEFPAAVAGGNVECSQRLVDLCFLALGEAGADVPAQSAGTMNNLSFGGMDPERGPFAFYETMGGGAGASAHGDGASGVQTHMTNTRNTSVEELEHLLPIEVDRYTLRRGTGGGGKTRGGDGILRTLHSKADLQVSLLTERRKKAPAGRAGAADGELGDQYLEDSSGERREVPAKGSFLLEKGQSLTIASPGGGGFGRGPAEASSDQASNKEASDEG